MQPIASLLLSCCLALLADSAASADDNSPPPAMPFFPVAKMDVELCNNVPPGDVAAFTKVPQVEACKGHAVNDVVCICLKPIPAIQKMLEEKKTPVNKNGFMPCCGTCDKDSKWTPS